MNHTKEKKKSKIKSIDNLEINTNKSTKEIIVSQEKEEFIKHCVSNENEFKKKKRKRTLDSDPPLWICNDINNTHFNKNSANMKKKRKLNIDNLEINTNKDKQEAAIKKETVEFIKNVENCSFNEHKIKKNKKRRTVCPDTPFENNSTEEMTINQDTKESIKNIENCSFNKNETNKKKHKTTVPTGESFENNSVLNYRSLEVTPTKKKKKSKMNLDYSDINLAKNIEEITKCQQETDNLVKNDENYSCNENKIKNNKTDCPDRPFENNYEENTRFEVMTKKKKSKYKTNVDNLEININNITEEMTINQDTKESIKNIENCSFNKNETNKKKHKTTVPTGESFENNSVLNYRSLEVTPTKKKKKSKMNLDYSDINIAKNIEEITKCQQETDNLVKNDENYSFNENKVKKIKNKKTDCPDRPFENISEKNNTSFEVMTPKKKSKYKTNVDNLEININNSTEKSIGNFENCNFNEKEMNEKKYNTTVPTVESMENNSVLNYRSLEVTPTKKKKKSKMNLDYSDINIDKSIEEITKCQRETDNLVENDENYSFDEKKIKNKKTGCPDRPFENNYEDNNTRFEVMTPKKKSKCKTNVDNLEMNINNNTEEITINQDTKESIKNIENCSLNKNETNKKKHKTTVPTGESFENNSEKNNTRFEVMTPKKKSKYKTNVDNLEININNSTEESIGNFENCNFKEKEMNEKKYNTTVPTVESMENNSVLNYRSLEVTPTKKKKKSKMNLGYSDINIDKSIEEITKCQRETDNLVKNDENYSFDEKKIKNKKTGCPDRPFENNYEDNNTRFEVMTPKKKSKCKTNVDNLEMNINNSTEEVTINQDTKESIKNIENCSLNKNETNKKKHKTTVPTGESFENNSEKNNTRFEVMTPKKKSKYKTNVDNLEININNSTEESIGNFENCNFKEKEMNEKKYNTTVPTVESMENNSVLNYRSLEVTPTKKKKKSKMNLGYSDINIDKSIEEITKCQRETDNLVKNDENYSFDEKKIKNKKTGCPDRPFENNYEDNNTRFEVMTPKKKSKCKTNVDNLEMNINNSTEEVTINQDTKESIKNIENCSLNKNETNKKKHKTTVPTGESFENNSEKNNTRFEVMTPKKKSKYKTNVDNLEININNSTEESIGNFENCNFNETEMNEKKYNTTVLTVESMENNSVLNYRSLEVTPTKKKKKSKMNLDYSDINIDKSIEEITKCQRETDNLVKNDENYSFDEKKIKNKKTGCPDRPFENNYEDNNTRFEVMTPKKKSKCKTNVDNLEMNINNSTEEMTINQDTKDSIKNIENCSFNKNKKKHKTTVPIVESFENNSVLNYRSLEVTPTKKKKKSKMNLDYSDINIDKSIEEITKCQRETDNLVKNVENCSFKANEITINKSKKPDCPDLSFENNSEKNNTMFEVIIPKRKSQYETNTDNLEININNSTEEITTNQDTEESIKNNENCSFNKIKKKHKTTTGESLENNSDINYGNLEVPPTKKNKKSIINLENLEINIDKSIDEMTRFQQETEEFVKNFEYCFEANETINNNGKITDCPDSAFENNSEKNNTRIKGMTPKKESEYKTNINNLEINVHNNSTEEITINQDTEESIKNRIFNENETKNNKLKRTVPTSKSLVKNSEKSNTSFKEKCKLNIKKSNSIRKPNNNNNISDSHRCQINSELRDILNCIEELESNEEFNLSDTAESLIDSLTSTDPSVKKCSDLNNQFKKYINLEYKVVKKWEYELLRFIGQKMLAQILAKYTNAKDIMNLCIHVSDTNPLHFVETKLSRQPKKEEIDQIRKQYPLLKLGVFNKDEDNIIREYWSKFQQEYNISDVQPFLLNGLKMASGEKFNFFRYISAGLPNRLLYSVYNRFNVLFNEREDSLNFTEEEDKFIQRVNDFGAIKCHCSVSGLILNRTRLQVYRRMNTLKMQHLRQFRIYWDIAQHQELFTNILIETKTENWKDLKNIIILKDTWIAITERCSKNINNYEKNRNQWKFLSTMLFCEKPIVYSTFKSTIFQYLLELNPKSWSDIDWVKITDTFYPGANSKVIVTLFYRLVIEKLPWEERINVGDSLKYLSNNADDYISNGNNDKVFPRLTVEDHDVLVKIE